MKKEEKKINFEENIQKLENEAFELSKECDQKLKEVSESVNKILTKEGNLEDFKIEE